MGRLFVVATPIGNLEDISARALRVLRETDVVVAEDTRVAARLLRHFGIKQRTLSYNEHNRVGRIPQVLQALAEGDVALVTDAGTPAISDPGVELVAAARAAGHSVLSVPGPSAVVAALSVAGVRATPFLFQGFLPRTAGELRRFLQARAAATETLVAFEAPTRLRATLRVLGEVLGERRMAVCRELTKLHEETFVGTAAEALAHFESPRGEIVLVVEGAAAAKGPAKQISGLEAEIAEMKALGLTRAQASALLANRHGLSRRQAYALWLRA